MTFRSHGSQQQAKTLLSSECLSTICLNGTTRSRTVAPNPVHTLQVRNMNTQTPLWQVWHVSRGIVFAGGSTVVYPQLPSVRHSSSSADALPDESGTSLPLEKDDRVPARSESPLPAQFFSATRQNELPSPPSTNVSKLQENSLEDSGVLRISDAVKELITKSAAATKKTSSKPKKKTYPKPPYTPLAFKIPDDVFREAKAAKAHSPESFWSYSLYRGPSEDEANPDSPPSKIKVHYCKSAQTMERVLTQHFMNEPVVGFDLEWAPNAAASQGPRRNVSLIQLASPSRVALFHVAVFPQNKPLVSPSFIKLMGDPAVTKVGVWVRGDANRLQTYLEVESKGLFELSHLYNLLKCSTSGQPQNVPKRLVSLARQVEEHLGLPMHKGRVRFSDWSAPLQMKQIIYAASDAYAGVQLYSVLDHLRLSLSPTPPLPHHAELNKPIRLAEGIVLPHTEETVEEEVLEEGLEKDPELPTEIVKYIGESIQVEADGDSEEPPLKEDSAKPKKAGAEKPPKDGRVVAAELWLGQYKDSHPTMRAQPAAMRAYYIWHSNDALKPEDVAAIVRDPPLQMNTVTQYVLEAVRIEKLPFVKARLKADFLDQMPEDVLTKRYRTLKKVCEDEGSAE